MPFGLYTSAYEALHKSDNAPGPHLTPEEIKGLFEAGELDPNKDGSSLHPDERKVLDRLWAEKMLPAAMPFAGGPLTKVGGMASKLGGVVAGAFKGATAPEPPPPAPAPPRGPTGTGWSQERPTYGRPMGPATNLGPNQPTPRVPPNLTQQAPTEAVAAGNGPSGGARGVRLRQAPPAAGGSGRSFELSANEQAGMDELDALQQRTGRTATMPNSGSKAPGARPTSANTSAKPVPSSDPRVENPPGTHKATTPDQWKSLADDYANKNEDPAVLERLRQRIAGELDAKPKPKTQRRTPKGK